MSHAAIQQALHGYGDGHQLLASSTHLATDQDAQLLLNSDLAGPTFRRGFDPYLTGYPISGGGFYVLAKTWYATEMPRPGCVWTHSLLIPDELLARIRDLRELLPLFRRPVSIGSFEEYASPLHEPAEEPLLSPSFGSIATEIVEALYGQREPVLVAADSSERYESLILGIVSQQWPRLRRSFRFCTGSLIRRRGFDLLVVPEDSVGSSRSHPARVVGRRGHKSPTSNEEWLQFATDDLERRRSGLRDFLWKYGPDYQDGRRVFRLLSELYRLASHHEAPDQAIRDALTSVAQAFPEQDSSKRLKQALFAPNGLYSELPGGDIAILQAVLTHPGATALPDEAVALPQRTTSLLKSDLSQAIQCGRMTLALKDSANAGPYLDLLANHLAEMRDVPADAPLDLLQELTSRNWRIVCASSVWRRPQEDQFALFTQTIDSLKQHPEEAGAAVKAMLEAESWRLAGQSLRMFSRHALKAVFQWLPSRTHSGGLELPTELLPSLSACADSALDYVGNAETPIVAKLVAALVDARSPRVARMHARDWIAATRSTTNLLNSGLELHARTVLLAIGLNAREQSGAELVAYGFPIVYDAASRSELPEHLWRMIEPTLPWYAFTWDRCARMVRGVLDIYFQGSYPLKYFFVTFATREAREQALRNASYSWDGRQLMRRMVDDFERGQLPLDPQSLQALRYFAD